MREVKEKEEYETRRLTQLLNETKSNAESDAHAPSLAHAPEDIEAQARQDEQKARAESLDAAKKKVRPQRKPPKKR